MPVKTHTNAVTLALIELSRLGCMVARREVGLFYDRFGGAHHIGVPGEADIQGIRSQDGRGIGVEIKIGADRQRKKQNDWATAFRARGGIAIVCRPDKEGWEDELRKLLNEP